MFSRHLTLAFTLCLSLAAPLLGQSAKSDASKTPDLDYYFTQGFQGLVARLGSSSYLEREKACRDIESFGPQLALEPLRRMKRGANAEANRRIDALIRVLEIQLLTHQILAPKEVALKLQDAEVQQAIAELASNSGYPVQFLGDATKFADKKITLVGKMPFWAALDQLCDQAGLMERVDLSPQAVPMPLEDGKRVMRRLTPLPVAQPMIPAGPIVLVNRGGAKSYVSRAGAVKTELRITRDADAKELNLLFVVSAEPRLLNHALLGRPVLDKAIDEADRQVPVSVGPKVPGAKADKGILEDQPGRRDLELLQAGLLPMQQPNRRVAQIRLSDEHAAKQLKELAGKLDLQVDRQNEVLAKIDKVMDSAGKSTDGANGGSLKLASIKKLANGHIEAQISLENLGPNPFAFNIIRGNVQIQGGGMVVGVGGARLNNTGDVHDLPSLVDAKGQKFKLIGVSSDSFNFINGSRSRTATLVYEATPGQVEPSELVLFGTRTHTIAAPFRFKNVPLP